MTNYKELRALCDAATDGDNPIDILMDSSFCDGWQAGYSAAPDCRTVCDVCDKRPQKSVKTCREKPSVSQQKEARKFIAATDPQTVRALIDEIEKLRGALEEIANMGYSQPAALDMSEEDWLRRLNSKKKLIAKQALGENNE